MIVFIIVIHGNEGTVFKQMVSGVLHSHLSKPSHASATLWICCAALHGNAGWAQLAVLGLWSRAPDCILSLRRMPKVWARQWPDLGEVGHHRSGFSEVETSTWMQVRRSNLIIMPSVHESPPYT
jgi:hypothetical protein